MVSINKGFIDVNIMSKLDNGMYNGYKLSFSNCVIEFCNYEVLTNKINGIRTVGENIC